MGSGQGWIAAVVTLSLAVTASAEFRSIDGTGNHSSDPTFGSVDVQLLRLTDPAYQDGASAPRGGDPSSLPSARAISNAVAAQSGSVLNARNLTDMAWLWGQFLDHDIDLTEGAKPDEPFNILVPVDDPYFGQPIMLNRSAFDPTTGTNTPRQQVNQITAYIDASNVYGSNSTRADALRTFTGGLLKTSAGNLLPFNTGGLPNADALGKGSDLFLAGDVRANENVALTGLHTLFLREHNRLAEDFDTRLNGADAGLTQMFNDSGLGRDEFLYQSARKVVGAQMQAITYNEFLPALLGPGALSPYSGYQAGVDPGISNTFS
ncbi:MAG: peroxidase family protein, partial [Phycisphaerae bacterium]|nr:peroxidase family protein [Phycisphaerae bacterium]